MHYCHVFFCSDNPEAKAILWAAVIAAVPALLAVIGAFLIGQRQLQLLDYQAALQGEIGIRAAEIEKGKLKADLFDRRMAVYTAAQAFVGVIMAEGEGPQFKTKGSVEEIERQATIAREFSDAIGVSKYLFSQEVHDSLLNDLWRGSANLHFHNTSKVEDGNDHAAKAMDLFHDLAQYDLDGLMGDWLRL